MKEKLVLFCNEGGSQVVIAKLIWALRPDIVVSLSSREQRRFPNTFWKNMAECSPGLIHLHVSTPPPGPGVDRPDTARRLQETLDGIPLLQQAPGRVVFDITSGMGLLRELQGKAVEAWAQGHCLSFMKCYCDSESAEVSLLSEPEEAIELVSVPLRFPAQEDHWIDVRMRLFSGLKVRRETPQSSGATNLPANGLLLEELDRYRCPTLRLLVRRGIIDELVKALGQVCSAATEEYPKLELGPVYKDLESTRTVDSRLLRETFHRAKECLESTAQALRDGRLGQLDIIELLVGKDKWRGNEFHLDFSFLNNHLAGAYCNHDVYSFFRSLARRYPLTLAKRDLRPERVGFEFEDAVVSALRMIAPTEVLIIRNRIISSSDGNGDRNPDVILGYPNGDLRFVEIKAYIPPLSGSPSIALSVMDAVKGFNDNLLELFGKYKSLDDMLGGKTRTFLVVPYTAREMADMGNPDNSPAFRQKLYRSMGNRLRHAEHFRRTLTVVPVDRLDLIFK